MEEKNYLDILLLGRSFFHELNFNTKENLSGTIRHFFKNLTGKNICM